MRVGLVAESQHQSLVDLLCELHAYYNEGACAPPERVESHLVSNLLASESPLRLVVASEGDDKVVGFAAIGLVYSLVEFEPEKRRQCQLKELYVRQACRGRGVGRALMTWVARYAIDNACCRVDWPVQTSNPRGIAFYQSLGAEQLRSRLSFRLSGRALAELAA